MARNRSSLTLLGVALLAVVSLPLRAGADDRSAECRRLLTPAAEPGEPQVSVEDVQNLRKALQNRMGFLKDPFLFATSLEKGYKVWQTLYDHFPPLRDVVDEAKRALRDGAPFDPALEERVLKLSLAVLNGDGGDQNEIAGAVEALRRVEQLLIRDAAEAAPVKDGASDPAPEPEAKEEKKKDEEKKGPPPPPEYPDFDDQYQAHNKDTENSSSGEQGQELSIAIVNDPNVRYFRGKSYATVDARKNVWSQLAMNSPVLSQPEKFSTVSVKLYPLGRRGEYLKALVPQGFIPKVFKNGSGELIRDAQGNYLFRTDQEFLEVPLYLQGTASRPLSPAETEIYTSPAGSKTTDWPEHLQQFILNLKKVREESRLGGGDESLILAKLLADYIAGTFKYRVDKERGATFELAARGAFQCDTSATIAVSILRDEFNIPARPVAGFRGSVKIGDSKNSHVSQPGLGHAWFEVPDARGNWHGFDATPKTPDRETEKKGEGKSQYRPIADENKNENEKPKPEKSGEPTPKEETHDGTPAEPGDEVPKTLEELRAEAKAMQKKAQDSARDRSQTSKSEGRTEGSPETDEKSPESEGEIGPEAAPATAALEELLKRIDSNNPMALRLLKRMVLRAIDVTLPEATKVERLNEFKVRLQGRDEKLLGLLPVLNFARSVLVESNQVFKGSHPPFDRWLEKIVADAPTSDLNRTVEELVTLQSQVEFTLRLMDDDESAPLRDLSRQLTNLRRSIGRIKHPDSEAIRIAEELFHSLPGQVSRRVLRKQYGLMDSLGEDVATLNLSRAISGGKLNDYRLMAILGDHTDFLVNPIRKYSQGERKTWIVDPKTTLRRRTVMMTDDPRDWRKFVRLHPELSDREALAQKKMGFLARRRVIRVPEGFVDTDPEKATIVLIDTSGSMAGANAGFQSMYVGALVDRALSDVKPNGKGRHRVYIMAFDTTVHDVIEVTDSKQAMDLIRDLKSKTRNSGGGTDIEAALIRASTQLKEANEKGDKALARATVVLCSDGQSQVNPDRIKASFAEVGGGTQILMGFVAIGGSNPQLYDLATSVDLGADRSLYIEWSTEDIKKVMELSEAPATALNDFWTRQKYSELPPDILSSFRSLKDAAREFAARTLKTDKGVLATRELQRVYKMEFSKFREGNRVERRKGTLAEQMHGFRRVLNFLGPVLSMEERAELLEDIAKVWSTFLPEPMDALDKKEMAELGFLLGWVENPLTRNAVQEGSP